MKTLILGGVRSGKSRLAERIAIESQQPVTYIATATARDDEMRARIQGHRANRPTHWKLIEEPLHLANALKESPQVNFILVDCLTLWLTNLLTEGNDDQLQQEQTALLEILSIFPGELVLVSNETNMGVTPMGELSRRYCDEAGRLHQLLAQTSDRVILMVAGLPQILKGDPL